MTRAEDVWAPPRADRTVTLRFGTISASASPGFADVAVAAGPLLVGVPVFGGASTVGLPVLILHDGAKVVAVVGTATALGGDSTTPTPRPVQGR